MESGDRHILLPFQRRFVNDPARTKIWLSARQVGKSFAIAAEALAEAANGADCLVLSSSERQSTEVMRKVHRQLHYVSALSGGVIGMSGGGAQDVTLMNGARIVSLPASPNTVRGFSGHVFLDEFAFHTDSEAIWRAMYPTVSRGYKVRITSTPNGRQNMFYRLWHGGGDLSRHRTTIHDAARQGLKVDVAALRAGIRDPESWAQEYECEFLDGASAFLTYEAIASCASEATLWQGAPPEGHGPVCLGVDIARRRDLTVIWALERVGDVLWTRAVREFRNEPFATQRAALYALIESTGAARCAIDASGIGAQMAEEARERFGGRIEPVVFTAQAKEEIALTLRRAFEDRSVRVPDSRDVREDLHSLTRQITGAGNVRFDAARGAGSHADRFWALALAVRAAGAAPEQASYESLARRGLFRAGGGF